MKRKCVGLQGNNMGSSDSKVDQIIDKKWPRTAGSFPWGRDRMGRPGVTYEEVASAAEELSGRGKNPTIESARAFIGSGSSGTLGPFLRTWKARQGETRQIAMKESLPEELVSLMKGLWTRVFAQAEDRFGRERQEIEGTRQTLQQQLGGLQKELAGLQQQCRQKDQEISGLTNDRQLLEQSVAALKNENAAMANEKALLEKQAAHQQIRIEELHRLHQQVQKNLEHYREASLEQRRHDQQSHENQKHQLEQTIHQLRHDLGQLQHQNAVIQHKNDALLKENDSLTIQCRESKAHAESFREKLTDSEFRFTRSEKMTEELREKIRIVENQYNAESRNVHDARGDLAAVSQKLAVTEEALRKMTDQNQMLVRDKWILEQERKMFYEKSGSVSSAEE